MRLAASRIFWTAGSSSPIRMAMMAMTTKSSMSVNADRRAVGEWDMDLSPAVNGKGNERNRTIAAVARGANPPRCGPNGRGGSPNRTVLKPLVSRRTGVTPKTNVRGNAARLRYAPARGGDGMATTVRDQGAVVVSQDVQERKAECARLLVSHQARLYGYILSLVPDLTHADDLYQQTALVLWGKFDQYDRSRSFFAWACGVARFEAANYVRALARQRRFFGDDLGLLLVEAHDEIAGDELTERRAALGRGVDTPPPADRALLTECYLDPAGVPAAAARRNRSPHSVYNSLRRIRQALSECVRRTLGT